MADTSNDGHATSSPPTVPEPDRFSLRFLAGSATVSAPGAPSGEQDRLKVLRALDEKTRSLSRCEGVLEALLDTDDLDKFDAVDRKLDHTVREKLECRARFSAIDHGRPFRQPPAAEEQRLLAAIGAVSKAIANTERWVDLLTAVDSLVQAYAAKETKGTETIASEFEATS